MSSRFVPGSLIKQYRIGVLLGRGGMGEVYAAEDTRLGGWQGIAWVSDETLLLTRATEYRVSGSAAWTGREPAG